MTKKFSHQTWRLSSRWLMKVCFIILFHISMQNVKPHSKMDQNHGGPLCHNRIIESINTKNIHFPCCCFIQFLKSVFVKCGLFVYRIHFLDALKREIHLHDVLGFMGWFGTFCIRHPTQVTQLRLIKPWFVGEWRNHPQVVSALLIKTQLQSWI